MVLAILAEAAEAAGPGVPLEIIAFIAASAGTLFGGGVAFGIYKKRFEDAERGISAAAEACRTANQNKARIDEIEKRQTKFGKRVEDLESEKVDLAKAVTRLVDFMRHSPGQAVPNEVLDDISDVLGAPARRSHQQSI